MPTTCATSWDRRPIVEFVAVPAGVQYEIFRTGVVVPLATIGMAGQNYFRPSAPIGVGAPPPGEAVQLYVRACRTSDPTCCATSATVSTRLIEACSTAIVPTATNVVFSEYLINGDGGACPGADCEAGEAIEITNLSHCPVTMSGHHFSYCNATCTGLRWMDFGTEDVIPPRGVYVAIRSRAASICAFPFLGADDPGLFGLRTSRLTMMGMSLASGWFNNTGGGTSVLRVASGSFVDMTSGTTVAIVSPYRGGTADCAGVGFDAVDGCGDVAAGAVPLTTLAPSQLGRLWHPCDAVRAPVPATCR